MHPLVGLTVALVVAVAVRWWRRPPEVHFVVSERRGGCAITALVNLQLYRQQRRRIERGEVVVRVARVGAAEVPRWVQRFYDAEVDGLARRLEWTVDGALLAKITRWIRLSFNTTTRRCCRRRIHRRLGRGEPVLVVEPRHIVLIIKANGRYHRLDRAVPGASAGAPRAQLRDGIHGLAFRA